MNAPSQLITAITFYKPNHCIHCGKNEIEIFNHFGKPMGYSRMILMRNQGVDFNVAIGGCRCRLCGHVYTLKFDVDGFPIPIAYPSMHEIPFMKRFISLGVEREKRMMNR